MIQRFLNWLADANGWSGVRFDPPPVYTVTFWDGSTFTLYIDGKKVSK